MSTSPLVVSHDLSEFFRQELSHATQILGVSLKPGVEFYVVNMLCSYSHAKHEQDALATMPLAVLLDRVKTAPVTEQAGLFRALGDGALYMAGFFVESFERTLIEPDYYVAMGSTAYRQAAVQARAHHKLERMQTYLQLAEHFTSLVDLLNHVAAKSQGRSGRDADILKLYERYARTKNERTRKILVDCGLSVEAREGAEPIH